MNTRLNPISSGAFTIEAAAHLLRRAVIGIRPSEVASLHGLGLNAIVDELLQPIRVDVSAVQHLLSGVINSGVHPNDSPRSFDYFDEKAVHYTQFRQWICSTVIRSPVSLHMRMALMWHHHFPVSCNGAEYAEHTLDMFRGIMAESMGNIQQLTKVITESTAMQIYLSGVQNWWAEWGSGVNENHARELLEIHLLGRTNSKQVPLYSQRDIVNIARALTGNVTVRAWTNHGDGTRTNFRERALHWEPSLWYTPMNEIFGVRGFFRAQDVIDVIFQMRAKDVALHFARRICTEFIGRRQELLPEDIEAVAEELVRNNWDITLTMRTLLRSEMFYDERYRMRLVKSPLHLVLGAIRAFDAEYSPSVISDDHLRHTDLVRRLLALGHLPFDPPNVSGWRSELEWLTPSDVNMRFDFCQRFGKGLIRRWDVFWEEPQFSYNPVQVAEKICNPRNADLLVNSLVGTHLGTSSRDLIDELCFLVKSNPGASDTLRLVFTKVLSSPRYQLF